MLPGRRDDELSNSSTHLCESFYFLPNYFYDRDGLDYLIHCDAVINGTVFVVDSHSLVGVINFCKGIIDDFWFSDFDSKKNISKQFMPIIDFKCNREC